MGDDFTKGASAPLRPEGFTPSIPITTHEMDKFGIALRRSIPAPFSPFPPLHHQRPEEKYGLVEFTTKLFCVCSRDQLQGYMVEQGSPPVSPCQE